MSRISRRLDELGLVLPMAAQPSFNYVAVVVQGSTAWVSGQLPKVDGEVRVFGKVGGAVTLEVAREQARICVLQGLACLEAELGSLDRIERVIKVTGFVASAAGFNAQPKVIDAASDLLVDILGPIGRHARSAVGVAELPRDAAVEIEFVVSVKQEGEGA